MKQTAVEFLEKEITQIMSYFEEDGAYSMKGAQNKIFGEKNIFQQAKEMEREQIVDAYWSSYKEGQYSGDKTADEYYNETYKQQSVTDDSL